jgi:PPOX class probable F420-dependent enzyme
MIVLPETHADLLSAETAVLATFTPAGHVQTTVIWFLADEQGLHLSLHTGRQKYANLLRNPECTLLIVDPQSPYRYAEFRCVAVMTPDDGYAFARVIAKKYATDYEKVDLPGSTRMRVDLVPHRINLARASGVTGAIDVERIDLD